MSPMRVHTFGIALLAMAMCISAGHVYKAKLSGNDSVPMVKTPGFGNAIVTIVNGTYATGTFAVSDIKDTFMAHIHIGARGASGPAAVWAYNFTDIYGMWQPISVARGTLKGSFWFNPSAGGAGAAIMAGNAYFNVHTNQYPGGEIRGQFAPSS